MPSTGNSHGKSFPDFPDMGKMFPFPFGGLKMNCKENQRFRSPIVVGTHFAFILLALSVTPRGVPVEL